MTQTTKRLIEPEVAAAIIERPTTPIARGIWEMISTGALRVVERDGVWLAVEPDAMKEVTHAD